MTDVRIYATSDGRQVDVTEGVQVMYDHLIASLDWGSGFLDVEEMRAIVLLAETCGFDATEAKRSVNSRLDELRFYEEQKSCPAQRVVPCPHGYTKDHFYCLREHPDCPGPTLEPA